MYRKPINLNPNKIIESHTPPYKCASPKYECVALDDELFGWRNCRVCCHAVDCPLWNFCAVIFPPPCLFNVRYFNTAKDVGSMFCSGRKVIHQHSVLGADVAPSVTVAAEGARRLSDTGWIRVCFERHVHVCQPSRCFQMSVFPQCCRRLLRTGSASQRI